MSFVIRRLVYLLVFLFTFLSLYSFYPEDPSLLYHEWPDTQAPRNFFGLLGAHFSGFAVLMFGRGRWLIPLPALQLFILSFLRKEVPYQRLIFGWTLLFLSGTFLLGFFPEVLETKVLSLAVKGMLVESLSNSFYIGMGEKGGVFVLFISLVFSLWLVVGESMAVFKYLHFHWVRGLGNKALSVFNKRPNEILTPQFALVSSGPQVFKDTSFASGESCDEIPPRSASIFTLNEKSFADVFVSHEQKEKLPIETTEHKEAILSSLKNFGIEGQILESRSGPVLSVYEFRLKDGIRQSKLMSLGEDLALSLEVESVFINLVPERGAVGIEVPHPFRRPVFFGDLLEKVNDGNLRLPLYLGVDVAGEICLFDLAKMPHLLIAGATGSGKSVGINAILASLLTQKSPSQVRLLLVDPKMLELSAYEDIPHLLAPVITDPQKANAALKWAVREMENRYEMIQKKSVRSLEAYNEAVSNDEKLPEIVIIIDELADLMLSSPKEVELSIQRLAQKARASGIHMVLATQRPSVDVITGLIKANFPTRISYRVASRYDSRTILDTYGAEKLLGKGDLLLLEPGKPRLKRMQGAFISDAEVIKLVQRVKKLYGVYQKSENFFDQTPDEGSAEIFTQANEDPMWDEALRISEEKGSISSSYLQRTLKIGYNRAARIVEEMDRQGLISPQDGVKPRKWLQAK